MPSQKDVRPIRALAFLLALLSPFLAGIAGLLMAPPADNKPIVDTPTAARDVGAAVEHILQKRGVGKIDLMGWSWGTAIMGLYTTTHNDKVNRLVLYAPAWTFTTRPAIGGGEAPLGAYRTVSKDSARQRWLNGVPEAKKADLIPEGWFEQWADATWHSIPWAKSKRRQS